MNAAVPNTRLVNTPFSSSHPATRALTGFSLAIAMLEWFIYIRKVAI